MFRFQLRPGINSAVLLLRRHTLPSAPVNTEMSPAWINASRLWGGVSGWHAKIPSWISSELIRKRIKRVPGCRTSDAVSKQGTSPFYLHPYSSHWWEKQCPVSFLERALWSGSSLFCVQPICGDTPRNGNLRRLLACFWTFSPTSLCFCGRLPGDKWTPMSEEEK